MHIACHFGHIDLALSLMKQGVRADDPVGYHPNRQWCNVTPHVDSMKPPIHECAEQGQVGEDNFLSYYFYMWSYHPLSVLFHIHYRQL